ncbi:WD-40 repeat-containing protein [Jimgerdemannia flammicorona]|uniref:ASTRA-associated protein 1 n=1 Tax=Jimgerdemannia flammicorona TaxID=994334 RepID=A0A433PSG2_9FUNG|nr:WD-40 repeat-containing protein [Jimgerdemannia flammicorona]
MPKEAPTPKYIFRGHTAQVNTLVIFSDNTALSSGDADGNVLVWDLKTRRTTVRWKAHEDGVLELQEWGDKLITHGRDNKIHVWDLTTPDSLTTGNPLFSLPVNALNFCKFSSCSTEIDDDDDLLVAVPSIIDTSMIDIFSLRHQTRLWAYIGARPLSAPPSKEPPRTGLCMALRLFRRDGRLYLLAGFESGGLVLWRLRDGETRMEGEGADSRRVLIRDGVAEMVWEVKEHNEVVLAIDISPDTRHAISTSADDKIVKYSILDGPAASSDDLVTGSITLKHAGVSDVRIRSDGRIFATGGWDGRIRIFSLKTLKPLATLAYHRESVYALAFAPVFDPEEEGESTKDEVAQKHYVVGAGKDERISLWEIY